MNPVLGVFKKLALPITLVLEAFEAFKMIFVGSFTKNAEALSESISEKGILGRAWYGFTHMFQTVATFGYELVETFKPDGYMSLGGMFGGISTEGESHYVYVTHNDYKAMLEWGPKTPKELAAFEKFIKTCLLYTSPSPRDS